MRPSIALDLGRHAIREAANRFNTVTPRIFGSVLHGTDGEGNQQHHSPHIHAEYQGHKAVFAIESGELIEGSLPRKQLRLMQAWIELHQDELIADWQLAVNGEPPVKIAPLN